MVVNPVVIRATPENTWPRLHVDPWEDQPETHGAEVWNLFDERGHLDPVLTVAQFGVLQRCPSSRMLTAGRPPGPEVSTMPSMLPTKT